MVAKKTNRTRRHRKRRNALQVANKMPGFPTRKLVKMRYCDVITVAPQQGQMGVHQYRANSIYDPDASVGGHQPLGHDEWANLYNHYCVVSSKITLSAVPNALTNSTPIVYGCYLSDDQTIPSTIRNLCEQGLSGYNVAQPLNTKKLTMKKTYSCKKFFNLADIKDNQNRVGSSMGNNPHDQAFFNIWYASLDPSVVPPSLECLVTIEYLCIVNEPKSLAES